jgi:hypothetical protein
MEVDLNGKVWTHSRKLNLLLLKDTFRKGKNDILFFAFLQHTLKGTKHLYGTGELWIGKSKLRNGEHFYDQLP